MARSLGYDRKSQRCIAIEETSLYFEFCVIVCECLLLASRRKSLKEKVIGWGKKKGRDSSHLRLYLEGCKCYITFFTMRTENTD